MKAEPPTADEALLVRGWRAFRLVNALWFRHVPNPYPGPAASGELAVDPWGRSRCASWAADVIARASYPRVKVDPLPGPGELTLAGCVAWLEAFADGLRRAMRPTVAMPAAILGGVLDFCSQGIVPSATRSPITSTRVAQRLGAELARDKTFKTFTLGDMEHWRLTRPRAQIAFDLPFEEGASPRKTRPGVAAGARAVLTGPMLRAYMATWALMSTWTHEHGGNNPFGIFELDLRRVLGELYGLRSVPTKAANGKSYSRPSGGAERSLKKELARLQLCLLEGIGPVTVSQPEALVVRYRHEDGREVYRHAPLAMYVLGQRYIQVPREVLRLDAGDTRMAMGLARVLHRDAATILRGAGHWRGTLAKLARGIAEPVEDEARRDGAPRVYAQLAEQLQRVTREGALGALHVEGEGPKALVTLTPSEALATIYSTIAERPARPLPALLAPPPPARRRAR